MDTSPLPFFNEIKRGVFLRFRESGGRFGYTTPALVTPVVRHDAGKRPSLRWHSIE